MAKMLHAGGTQKAQILLHCAAMCLLESHNYRARTCRVRFLAAAAWLRSLFIRTYSGSTALCGAARFMYLCSLLSSTVISLHHAGAGL